MTYSGPYDSWQSQAGMLTCTMTNEPCPTCDGRLWREERTESNTFTSNRLMAFVCHNCKRVFVEKKEYVPT